MHRNTLLQGAKMAFLLMFCAIVAYGQNPRSGNRWKDISPVDLAVGGRLTKAEPANTFGFAPTRILADQEFNAITGTTFLSDAWPNQTANPNVSFIGALSNWAKNKNKKFHGHALCYPGQHHYVEWWNNQSNAQLKTNLEKLVKQHVAVASSNGRQAWVWDVVNEVIADPAQLEEAANGNYTHCDYTGVTKGTFVEDSSQPSGYRFVRHKEFTAYYEDGGYGPEYIAECFRWAREVDSNAILIINDYGCEQERVRDASGNLVPNIKANKLLEFCIDLRNQGVPIQGVGFQCHFQIYNPDTFDTNRPNDQIPDFAEIRSNFQRFADEGFQIFITELDVKTVPVDSADVGSDEKQNAQAAIYREMAQIAVDMPAVKSLLLWDFVDERSWLHDSNQGAPVRTHPTPFWGGLASENGNDIWEKESYRAVQEVFEDTSLEGEYRLKNNGTGKYLAASSNVANQFVATYPYNPNALSERWHLEPVAGETDVYRLRCEWSNATAPNYLHGTNTNNAARVRAWRDQPTWYWQRWRLESEGGNVYRLKNFVSDTYLYGNSINQARLYEDRAWASQRWTLEPVE